MSGISDDALEAQILAAHARSDSFRLAELYEQAAELKLLQGDLNAAGFLLTQAYVYALDSGHTNASHLRERLVADNRELKE